MARYILPFACLVSWLAFSPLSAQVTRCSSDEHLEAQLNTDTAFARSFFALEAALEQMAGHGFRTLDEYTLPVVVHIMHDGDAVGSGANISDAQIASAIDALNADFAGEFGGADVDIQFSLAVRDPFGNPTSGINRVNAATTIPEFADNGMVTNSNQAPSSESNVKALSHWPGADYINIWVVSKLNGGTSPIGFAYLPPTSGLVDGIVIHHEVFGVGQEYNLMNNYDLNRTLTHEVGHYLGLYHTFHLTSTCGSESNCSAQGDRVCDTPPTTGSLNCSALECEDTMVENFMDYSNDPCMASFTDGQRTRMRNALLEHRLPLTESLGQVPVVDLDAGLSSVQGISPSGCSATHSPEAVLQNFGTTPINEATVHFQMDGGEEHIVAWQGELAPNQTALVPLPALAATIGTHSLTVWTQIPNDEYEANDAITMDFEVVPGNVVTMAIQFDFLPYGVTWAVESPSDEDPILSGGNYVNADFASQYISIQGCATPGCYTLTVEDLFGNGMHYSPPGWYELTDTDGNVLGAGSGDFGSEQTHEFCIEAADVLPCADENSNGVCDANENLLVTDIPGCTDPESCTFNALANVDNGSCTYPETNYDCEGNVTNVIAGCTDEESCTFDPEANTEDDSCAYLDALNDCGGDCLEDLDQDGICDNAEVAGCTQPLACNYNEEATEEDDSCEYASEGFDCEGNPLVNSVGEAAGLSFSVTAFPNPVSGGEVTLTGLPGPGQYEVLILDFGGRLLAQKYLTAEGTPSDWRVRPSLNLKPGMYMLHIHGQQAKSAAVRLLVD